MIQEHILFMQMFVSYFISGVNYWRTDIFDDDKFFDNRYI